MPENRNDDNTEQRVSSLGQYYLVEKIAQGGMAEIYRGIASDIHGIKKTVCIKKILPNIAANKEFVDMLVSEAKIAVQLSHGNIAQIFDLGKKGSDYFMVMEYVDGKSLSQIHKKCIKKGDLIPQDLVCYFVSEVAKGLDYMHKKTDQAGNPLGIVHRDISPQNIIVSYSGTIKIIDFGIAKAAFKVDATEAGVLKGKFAYMSPEQSKGEEIDGRSDIFSLGVILHELLTGRRLFKAKDNKETIRNVRRTEVVPPSKYVNGIPPELDAIVMKALAKDRSKRYQHAGEMNGDLLKFLHTKHSDFKPSSIAKFVTDLFADEKDEKSSEKETEHTPYLITDTTQPAINMNAPQIMKEFMLEEISEIKKVTDAEEDIKEPAKEEPPSESRELFFDKILKEFEKIKPVLKKYSYMIAAAAAIWLVVIAGAKTGFWRAWSDFFTPTTIDQQKEKKSEKTAPKFTKLAITTNPQGAKVFIDDRETQYKTPVLIEDIQADGNAHVIGLFMENYRYWSTTFSARPDETINFNVNLAMAYGTLEIISVPPGADVIINGEKIGITPFSKNDITPNSQLKVKLERQGFEPIEQDVYISQGSAIVLRPSLRELPAQLTPPSQQPTNTVQQEVPQQAAPEIKTMPPAGLPSEQPQQQPGQQPQQQQVTAPPAGTSPFQQPLQESLKPQAEEPKEVKEEVKQEEPEQKKAELPAPPKILQPPVKKPVPKKSSEKPSKWEIDEVMPNGPMPGARNKPMELDYDSELKPLKK